MRITQTQASAIFNEVAKELASESGTADIKQVTVKFRHYDCGGFDDERSPFVIDAKTTVTIIYKDDMTTKDRVARVMDHYSLGQISAIEAVSTISNILLQSEISIKLSQKEKT